MVRKKNSFRSKVFSIATVLIIAAALLYFGYVVINSGADRDMQKRAISELSSEATDYASILSKELNDEFSSLSFIHENYEDMEKQDTVVLETFMKSKNWSMLGYADSKGNAYSYDGEKLGNIGERKYFSDPMDGKADKVIEYIPEDKGDYVIFSIPVKQQKENKGIIFAGRKKELVENSFRSAINEADEQSIVVVDNKGNVITANSGAEESGRRGSISEIIDSSELKNSSSTIWQEMSSGKEGQFSYASDNKIDYGAFVPVSGSNWFVFCIMEKGESEKIYASDMKNIKRMVGFLSLAFCLLFLTLMYFVWVYVRKAKKQIGYLDEETKAQHRLIAAFEEEFEAVYSLNLQTGRYELLFNGGKLLDVNIPQRGDDVLSDFRETLGKYISESDYEFIHNQLGEADLWERLNNNRRIVFNCKLYIEGNPIYYQLRTTNGKDDIVYVGIRNIDSAMRRETEQMNKIKTLLSREKVYHDAIMSNSVGYFQANITTGYIEGDILDCREQGNPKTVVIEELGTPVKFNEFHQWWADNMVTSDKEMYLSLNNTAYLLDRFKSGRMAVTVPNRARFFDGDNHEWNQNYYMSRDAETGDIIAFGVLYDAERQIQLRNQIYSLSEELLEERIKRSLGQMQPHFLYNALSSIREIILDDPEYASDIVYDFSTYLRACIKSMTSKKLVPFNQELENIKAYINIEKMRFGDRLTTEYDIQADDFEIVPLSIQPLVENAVKHGLYSKHSRKGKVIIKTERIAAGVAIHIIDDGIGFDYSSIMSDVGEGKSDSTGLANTIFRLKKILGADVDVDSSDMGTHITIIIPAKEEVKSNEDNSSRR